MSSFSPAKGLAALTGNTEFDKYMAILKSGTMVDDVIKKYNLQKEFMSEEAAKQRRTQLLKDREDFMQKT